MDREIIDEEVEVKDVDIIVSKSDEKGTIIYGNPIFVKLSGYLQSELHDKPHSILRHPDMPKVVFKFLWQEIQAGREVYAFVKNLRKDGKYYWVFAHVRVAKNPDGSFRNYVSTRRKMSEKAKKTIIPLYKALLEKEKTEGVDASWEMLKNILTKNGASLETFNDLMKKIQNQ